MADHQPFAGIDSTGEAATHWLHARLVDRQEEVNRLRRLADELEQGGERAVVTFDYPDRVDGFATPSEIVVTVPDGPPSPEATS